MVILRKIIFINLLLLIPQLTLGVSAAPLIGLNSHGHDVVTLQKTLMKLHYTVNNTKGLFDHSTEEALKAFQKDRGLPITGKVDRSTWQLIEKITPWQGVEHNPTIVKQGVITKPVATKAATPIIKPEVKPETAPPKVVRPMPKVVVPQRKEIQPMVKQKTKPSKEKHKKNTKRKKETKPIIRKIEHPLGANSSSVPLGKEIITRRDADNIIRTAKKFIGTPYVFGGDTPSGFDCSGYLEYVFSLHNMKIPRTADVQYSLGRAYPLSKLEPGDLVFFSTYEAGVSHCGIYLGNKKFIHASTSRGVIIDDMDSDYWAPRFYGGKKIVK